VGILLRPNNVNLETTDGYGKIPPQEAAQNKDKRIAELLAGRPDFPHICRRPATDRALLPRATLVI